jgi:hypothetical protein
MDRLNIKNEMAAVDRKDRDYYDAMTDEEKKKFAPYLMVRWSSCVGGDSMLQSYYLMSANERLNKNFFDISASQHKKFLWLLATTVSPGMGGQYHQWIPPRKRESTNKVAKLIRLLRPDLREDEVELMATVNSKEEIIDLAREHGWEEKKIKEILK